MWEVREVQEIMSVWRARRQKEQGMDRDRRKRDQDGRRDAE